MVDIQYILHNLEFTKIAENLKIVSNSELK